MRKLWHFLNDAIVTRGGIEFGWHGDAVIWLWPWKRRGGLPFVSVFLSGTGEFGDARFASLRDIDVAWSKISET